MLHYLNNNNKNKTAQAYLFSNHNHNCFRKSRQHHGIHPKMTCCTQPFNIYDYIQTLTVKELICMYTLCSPTWLEGHQCWRRPLYVSALAGTLIGHQGPGQRVCCPLFAPPPRLGLGSSPPLSDPLELRYLGTVGEGCEEQ